MDCVGCDKCRLWGKVQTTGIATALKVLFELDEKALDPASNSNLLSRSEVVALINTLHRFSESLVAVNDFRNMWTEAESSEKTPRSQSSPAAGSSKEGNAPTHALQVLKDQLASLLRLCQAGTKDCLVAIQGWVAAFASLFKISSKDQGPHSEL